MIVFDLRCSSGHVFEARFGSSAAYAEQCEAGLVACPICGDCAVEKAVMAPNIGAKGNRATPACVASEQQAASPESVKATMAALAKAQATMLEGSEWVGKSFAERARAMHDGDTDPAPIHGQASKKEARALIDDGVRVAPLLFPVVPPEARN